MRDSAVRLVLFGLLLVPALGLLATDALSTPQNEDVDQDGLPDDWEMLHFGSLDQGPEDDPDLDGLNNLQEFLEGTDPLDYDSDDDGCYDGDEIDAGLDPLDGTDCDPSLWPVFVLDVGAEGDTDPGIPFHLDEGDGISDRLDDGQRTYRTIDESTYLYFRLKSEGLDLAENGVPYQHVIIDVDYQDEVDEENCSNTSSTKAYCRPRLAALLNYCENPMLEWHILGGVGGLNDGVWKRQSLLVEANPWQTLRSIDGYFEFHLYYPDQFDWFSPLPIDRITLRFIGDSRFRSLWMAERGDRGFIRSEYVPQDEPAQEDPFVLFGRNYLEKIYPNTRPAPDDLDFELSIYEIAGESEPVTFAVHAFEDLQDIHVSVSDLVSGTNTIPLDRIQIDAVHAAYKRWHWAWDEHYGLQPWYLDAPNGLALPASHSQQFWLTIHVPADAPPDIYTGDVCVDIEAESGSYSEIVPLTLTVYDIELDPPDALPLVYHSPYLTRKYFAARRSIASENMAAHDIAPIIYLDAIIDTSDLSIDFRDLAVELNEFAGLGILPPQPRVGITDSGRSLWSTLCPDQPHYTGECVAFEQAYQTVLETYADYFADWGVQPMLSFNDEPGIDPDRRRRANRLNRIAKAAGLKTWVTYYPNCEKPLAGYTFLFSDLDVTMDPAVPEWLAGDLEVGAFWNFESGTQDLSGNGNDGELVGGAFVGDGALNLPSPSAYMNVLHNDTIGFSDKGTIFFWFKPSECTSGYAWHPIEKWDPGMGLPYDANYVFYFFGDYGGQYQPDDGRIGFYATVDDTWTRASGDTRLDCESGMNQWYNIFWIWDAEVGGTMYVNGRPYSRARPGTLTDNTRPATFGKFPGSMDEIVLLERALSDDEAQEIAIFLNEGYDTNQSVVIETTIPLPAESLPPLCFSLHDELGGAEQLETLKQIYVNDELVWSRTTLDYPYQLFTVELPPPGGLDPVNVRFMVTNRQSRQEQLLLYFVGDFWRSASWTVSGAGELDNWSHTYEQDEDGMLGPMDPWLDDRVYAMQYVSASEAQRTREAGDTYSFYTTFPATQAVILNNRFLNGIYASALEADGVYLYAYGDWYSQPWDDTEPNYLYKMGNPAAIRAQGGYQLVLPSWEERVYDTVINESLREGIEDSRIIATLKRAIVEHPGSDADLATAFLANTFSGLSREYSPRYMHTDEDLPIHQYADRSAEILTDLVGDPDDFGALDRIRRQMIDFIIILQGEDECTENSDCGDGDICTWNRCIAGACLSGPGTYGDVDQNGAINIFDLFCILNGFGGDFTTCSLADCDIVPCVIPDGEINIFDLFAVLNAFDGDDPCCG